MANNVILVTGSYDHTLIFWDAYTGSSINVIEYPDNVLYKIQNFQHKKQFL